MFETAEQATGKTIRLHAAEPEVISTSTVQAFPQRGT
jgi:hypothetical protein